MSDVTLDDILHALAQRRLELTHSPLSLSLDQSPPSLSSPSSCAAASIHYTLQDIYAALDEKKRALSSSISTLSSAMSPTSVVTKIQGSSKMPLSPNDQTFNSNILVTGSHEAPSTLHADTYRFVVAPMVGASDLAFRLMTRRYGASLCYTPMFYSDRFVQDADYRERVFQTVPEDRPLVVQFAANNPQVLLEAAKLVQDQCVAIDINLGCPQREAKTLRYGSYLLDREEHALVMEMVELAARSLKIPVFCKIRLLPSLDETIAFARALESAGCRCLTVHGRKRGGVTKRRVGPADLSAIRAVKLAVNIPVIANGNVRCWQDVRDNMQATGADGIMSAEEILRNPALFQPLVCGIPGHVQEQDRLLLAMEYVLLAQAHGTPLTWVLRHVKYMTDALLVQFQVSLHIFIAVYISPYLRPEGERDGDKSPW